MPRPLQTTEPFELPHELGWRYEKQTECFMRGPFVYAAPVLGFYCHHPVKRTFPCYKLLKGCTLDCPFCRWRRQYTSYVALYDPNDRKKPRKVISGGKRTYEDFSAVPVGTVVSLQRGPAKTDTIRMRVWPEAIDERQLKKWREWCVEDITPYLFHLWQRRELTEHFGYTYYPSLNTLANDTTGGELSDDEAAKVDE